MIPSSSLLRTFFGLGLLAMTAPAQQQFMDLETQRAGSVRAAAQEESLTAKLDARADLPSLEFANRDAILAGYDESVRDMAELSQQPRPLNDPETGAEIQRSDLKSTSLGSAGGFFSATLGVKGMQEKSEWEPLDSQGSGSLEFAWRIPRKAFAGVAGLAGSYARQNYSDSGFNGEVDAWTLELYLGAKAYLEIPKSSIWGYAGAGVSFVYTEVETLPNIAIIQAESSNDWGVGVYAQLGLLLRLNRSQSIGIEYRGLFGTSTSFFNTDVSVDYNQFNFVFLVAF